MLTIAWEYLLDRLVAADPTDRGMPEWPPHPDRVFQALVAAWGEIGCPSDGRAALEWLESLPAPSLHVPAFPNAEPKRALTSFVPVNDEAIVKGKNNPLFRDLPIGRNRQPRTFPRFPVDQPCHLHWSTAQPDDCARHLPALSRLCLAATNVGHSSSLVRLISGDSAPPSGLIRYIPTDGEADLNLRIPSRGRLARLVSSYEAGQRPSLSEWQAYRLCGSDGERQLSRSVFSDRLVLFKTIGPNARRYGSTHIPALADALRKSAMARANDDPRTLEILSGHAREGGRLEVPHAAFVGLPFVGRPHADGHLIGMAMVLPRSLTHAEAEGCTRALAQCLDAELRITLRLGARGTLDLQAAELNETRHTLRVETWCGPSRGATTWATVTPIVLDRLPPRRTKDIEGFMGQVIARACERVGLPAPAVIRLSAASRFLGAPHAAQFPAVANKGAGGNRWHVHAMLEWGTPVRGPVLIGAGRYRGLGFLRPWHNKEQS